MAHIVLALDFGGTKLSAAVFTEQSPTPGREDAKEEFNAKTPRREGAKKDSSIASLRLGVFALNSSRRLVTPAEADATYELATMVALAREALDGRQPSVAGVSFGGPVDHAAGVVRLSHHVRGWEAMPLRDTLTAVFGCSVAIDNDANVAALGEHRFGAGRGVADIMYITVSTGVGGGWILGGQPWRGADGLAGEIGHTVVDPAGPLCLCGKRGCVERLASGPYMAADYVAQAVSLPGSRGVGEQGGADPVPGAEGTSGRDVAERAAAGDEVARAILLRGAWALGVGIGNAANLINPRRFVLGGGVTKSGEAWWAEVRHAAAATALPEVRFDVVPAGLGDDAPLWGALALAEGVSAEWAE